MITKSELLSIDKSYFTILQASSFALYIKSNCTGHQWGLLLQQYPTFRNYRVIHRHKNSQPYHRHKDCKSVKVAIEMIMSHDSYQMRGRRPATL
jgi:hypothetical protein